ncbi:MAG: hypothetical protein LC645_08730 [Geobacteraceae bacterium]|nr:hypothetical protein [Geobacteraceae bacterium]
MASEQTPLSLDEELQADRECTRILRDFHTHLIEQNTDPIEAGSLAQGADYFLRDFIISACRCSIFTPHRDCVKQFAGHWYIVNNLEPSVEELQPVLQGVAAFYAFLSRRHEVDAQLAAQIQQDCADIEWFKHRLDAFWAIKGDGYFQWRADCPLPHSRS